MASRSQLVQAFAVLVLLDLVQAIERDAGAQPTSSKGDEPEWRRSRLVAALGQSGPKRALDELAQGNARLTRAILGVDEKAIVQGYRRPHASQHTVRASDHQAPGQAEIQTKPPGAAPGSPKSRAADSVAHSPLSSSCGAQALGLSNAPVRSTLLAEVLPLRSGTGYANRIRLGGGKVWAVGPRRDEDSRSSFLLSWDAGR
jgi:hypothetical protein